jgi:hypothetical protein
MASLTGKPGESLKALVVAPTLWAIHLLVCYVAAAIYCAKLGSSAAGIEPVRELVWLATGIALAGIVVNGVWAFWRGRIWEHGPGPHGADTIADRRRFLAYATLLLAGLSFVSTLFTAMPALFIETCR